MECSQLRKGSLGTTTIADRLVARILGSDAPLSLGPELRLLSREARPPGPGSGTGCGGRIDLPRLVGFRFPRTGRVAPASSVLLPPARRRRTTSEPIIYPRTACSLQDADS